MTGTEVAVPRIVILGAGYAGIDAYKALARRLGSRLRRGEVQVTVVNPDPYHTFHGWTGEVLSGRLPLSAALTPLAPLFRWARVVLGHAAHVDLVARTVTVQAADGQTRTLPYDQLLIGTGSADPFARVPGLREHGWKLKNTHDMQLFRDHLHGWLSGRATVPEPGRILVVGGGFAGVEMAAAIRELVDARRVAVETELYTSAPHLLEALRPHQSRLADHAAGELGRLGVKVRTGAGVREITPSGVVLSSGEVQEFGLVLYTAGVSYDVLPGTEALQRDERGRLVVEDDLRLPGHPEVWAAGDTARVPLPRDRRELCPANALWAMKQGMCVGNNMAAALKGQPGRPFAYGGLGQAASLRVGGGVAELKGLPLTGWTGWLMRLGFFVWYMPTKEGGVRVLRAWAGSLSGRRHLGAAPEPRAEATGGAELSRS